MKPRLRRGGVRVRLPSFGFGRDISLAHMSDPGIQPTASAVPLWRRPERLAPMAMGVWLGGVAARALRVEGLPATLLLLALGGAVAAAAGRTFPRLRGASPLFLFLPLTLLPSVPGWRTLGATLFIFLLAREANLRLHLDEPRTAGRLLAGLLTAGFLLGTTVALLRIYWLADVRYGQDTAYAANLLRNTLH